MSYIAEDYGERVLACLFHKPSLIDELEPDDFRYDNHKAIFHAMRKAWNQNGAFDHLAVLDALPPDQPYHDEVRRLESRMPSAVNAADYVQNLRKQADKRKLESVLKQLALDALQPDIDPETLRDQALDALQRSTTKAGRRRRQRMTDLCKPLGERGWLSKPPPEPRALLKRGEQLWCPMGKTGALVAEGGTGKSQALIQLAISVATGRRWLDTFDVPEPGPVILGLAEEGPEDMWRRVYHAAEAMGLSGAERAVLDRDLFPIPLAGRANALMDANGPTGRVAEWEAMLELAPAGPWRLIAIDPASRFMGPDAETDNAAATRFVEVLESWAQSKHGGADVGPMVLFAHHTAKNLGLDALYNQGAARGSSAFTDGARWQANMVAVEGPLPGGAGPIELVGLNVTKSNDGIKGAPVWLRRGKHGVLELEKEPSVIASVIAAHDEPKKPKKPKRTDKIYNDGDLL